MQDVAGGAEYDPISAGQRAQFERQTQKSREAQIERLSRLGLLRGGGDTADVLAEFEGQVEMGRMQLGAEQAQRQQQALQQAIGFQQSQAGLEEQRLARQQQESQFGRGLGEQTAARAAEFGMAEQELGLRGELGRGELELRGELGRGGLEEQTAARQEQQALQRGEMLGEVGGVATLGTSELRLRERGLEEQQAAREAQQELQRGEMLGLLGDRETLGAQHLGEQRLGREQQATQFGLSLEEQQAARGQQAGQFEKGLGLDYQRLEEQREGRRRAGEQFAAGLEEQRAARLRGQELQEAGITGRLGDDQTLAAREMEQQRALQEAGITGQFEGADTLAARQLAQQETQFGRGLALDEAGVTGLYGGEQTQQARQQELENERAELAALTSAMQMGDEGQRQAFVDQLQLMGGDASGRFRRAFGLNPLHRPSLDLSQEDEELLRKQLADAGIGTSPGG